MKKYFARVLALLLISGLGFSLPASAGGSNARGEKALGIMGGFASYNKSGFASVYFQYRFATHVRIDPEIGCVFRNDDKSALLINADMQFPFRLSRGFNVYPLAGLTFNNWSERHNGSILRMGANAGAGFDLYMTDNFKLTLQAKYSFMKDCSGAFVGLGLGYLF